MRKLSVILTVFLAVVLFALPCTATPRAVFVDSVFEFSPLPEGEKILHEFIVQNTGDTPLNITNVLPPWGCDSHSYDRRIPPGEEGKIKIGIKTSGYGGKTLKKKILVKTDDPNNRKFHLVVTGKVEKVVDITPRTVSLSGAPGEVLEARVTITPTEKYRFSILGLEQKYNTQIKAQLVKPAQGDLAWQVKITSTSQKADDLYDVITLKTDSKYKPTLKIRVYAIYLKE
jgi:hypothetical protein